MFVELPNKAIISANTQQQKFGCPNTNIRIGKTCSARILQWINNLKE